MSNPEQGDARSHRQRHPTTNHGPAATRIRAYQSDPRRAQQPGPPPTQPTPHIPSRPTPTARNSHAPLDKRLSISGSPAPGTPGPSSLSPAHLGEVAAREMHVPSQKQVRARDAPGLALLLARERWLTRARRRASARSRAAQRADFYGPGRTSVTELSERIAGRLGGRERGGSWCALGRLLDLRRLDLAGSVALALDAELLTASE